MTVIVTHALSRACGLLMLTAGCGCRVDDGRASGEGEGQLSLVLNPIPHLAMETPPRLGFGGL